MRAMAAAALVLALTAGCASSSSVATKQAPVRDSPRAAREALQCEHPLYAGGTGSYDDGLSEVQSSYAAAAKQFMNPETSDGLLPRSGYHVERTTRTSVLLMFDVAGKTKAALVIRDGIRDYQHNTGWGVATWAVCDPAEYPAQTTHDLGIGVWQDQHGRRVPIARVQAFPGQDFCEFDGTEFFQTGGRSRPLTYVRDPRHQLTKYLRVPFDASATLPGRAIDTGLHRDGRELWFGSDDGAAYLVSQHRASDVERWSAFKRSFACG